MCYGIIEGKKGSFCKNVMCLYPMMLCVLIWPHLIRYTTWGGRLPHRPVEDLAFAVARFFQRGGSFQNYYMVIYLSQLCFCCNVVNSIKTSILYYFNFL